MTMPQPPAGQGPIDPNGAFSAAPPPPGAPQGPAMMPPGMAPPMMFPPMYPPPKHSSGFFRSVLTTLTVTIFLGSLSLNVYLLLFAGLMDFGGDGSTRQVMVEGDVKQLVAVLPIRGIITSKSFEKFDKMLKKIEKEKDLKALVVDVDTPGGEVTASDQIYQRILQFKEEKKVPVVVKQGAMATSGGYYISVAGDWIVAEPTTLTANIGVLLQKYNWAELADRWGIKETTTVSSGSTYKNAGSPFFPESERDQKYWQTLVDEMYGKFKTVVKQGRGKALKVSIDEAADGRALTSDQARDMGLVDTVGYAQDAFAEAASRAKLTKMHVVKYQEMPSFLDVLGAEASSGSSSRGVQINGVNLNLDPALLHELSTPKMLYLWRGQ